MTKKELVQKEREPIYDSAIPQLPPFPLVGRAEVLEAIKQWIWTADDELNDGGGTVALYGTPGVGKTALATALAHDPEVRAYFLDGVLWAGLGLAPDPTTILNRWGTLLDVSPTVQAKQKSDEWRRLLQEAIGERAFLIVLDDAWRIEDARNLQIGGPYCAYLITTRSSEVAATLAGEGAVKVEELSQEEGVQLLQMLVPGLDMTEKAQQLVQAVAGLPLALKLLGNYVRKQAYSGRTRRIIAALERIERLDERLSIQEPQAPTEQHPSLNADLPLSLRAVIAISEHQLPEQLQRAFYALATIPAKPNTFSEEMACAVMNCTVEQFHLVRDSGLLELSSQGRYTIHQTVHDYAWQRLHEVGGLEKAYCRLLSYLMDFGEMYQKEYELLQQECVTTLACLEQIVGMGKGKEFAELFLMYVPFLMSTAHYEITRQLALRAEAIGWEYKAPVLVVRALFYQGQVLQKLAHLAQAEECFRGALELAQQMNNEEYICSALTEPGWIESKRGPYEQAEQHLLDGLYMANKL